ncbi:MAG: glucose-1-phosphate thymidylyltransferase, partial [Pseudanabaena sp. ELA748]
ENCHLENAYIGPNTSVSDRVTIIDTDIEHSVILSDTKIIGIYQRIVDSVIGYRVSMTVSPKRPQALRFLVGDDSQLEIM